MKKDNEPICHITFGECSEGMSAYSLAFTEKYLEELEDER